MTIQSNITFSILIIKLKYIYAILYILLIYCYNCNKTGNKISINLKFLQQLCKNY